MFVYVSGDPHVHLEDTSEGFSFESSQVGIWVRGSWPAHCSVKPGKPVSAASSPPAGLVLARHQLEESSRACSQEGGVGAGHRACWQQAGLPASNNELSVPLRRARALPHQQTHTLYKRGGNGNQVEMAVR